MRTNQIGILLAVLLVSLVACGTVKIGLEHPPSPDLRTDLTARAQATEHAHLETEVAMLEATLGITPEPTDITASSPSPIAGDEPGVFYQPIPLGTVANAPSGFASPLTGQHTLGDIPFDLSAEIFKSQSSSPTDGDLPISVLFRADIPQASKAHLLLNTGNGLAQFEGQIVGQIIAYCGDTSSSITDLRLGQDVREWHLAHNVVYTAERPQQVWTGALAEYPHLTGHIDLFSLDLPEACKSGSLTALEIADTSLDTVGSLDPALNLFGVTIEYHR